MQKLTTDTLRLAQRRFQDLLDMSDLRLGPQAKSAFMDSIEDLRLAADELEQLENLYDEPGERP